MIIIGYHFNINLSAQEISDKLQFKILRTETLSVFTFRSKIPIHANYNVFNLKLDNKYLSKSRIETEALVTDEISRSDIPPQEVYGLRDEHFGELNPC